MHIRDARRVPANIFVLAPDDERLAALRALPRADRYRFLPLLDADRLRSGSAPVAELIADALRQLAAFDGRIDAIVGHGDFPVSTLAPVLCGHFELRGPSLEAVLKCEHRYWSRLEQRAAIGELPGFALIDLAPSGRPPAPTAPPPPPPQGLRYPIWLKPVSPHHRDLVVRVDDDEQYAAAVARIRAGVRRLGRPFDFVLDRLDLPPEVAAAGGTACLAEESLPGERVTVEGYSLGGRIEVYGIVDTVELPGAAGSLRHQYPSALPGEVQRRLRELTRRVIGRIGLDDSAFAVAFHHDRAGGGLGLLSVTPRHSRAYAGLFRDVDGIPEEHCMVSLALGEDPRLPQRAGPYRVAATGFLRGPGGRGPVRVHVAADDAEKLRDRFARKAAELGFPERDQLPCHYPE